MLALVFLLGAASAVASLPRGVGPDFAQHYYSLQQDGTFTCINFPDVKLSASQVNDHACDCPDGSDEPGTIACAHIDPLSPPLPVGGGGGGVKGKKAKSAQHALPGFWCENRGHVGAYIPFTNVDDGICDYDMCCDGTDELHGIVKCEDRCAAMGEAARRQKEADARHREAAWKKHQELAKQAQALVDDLTKRIAQYRSEVSALQEEKGRLTERYEKAQKEDRERALWLAQNGELSPRRQLQKLLEVARPRIDELTRLVTQVADQRNEAQRQKAGLEAILAELAKANPGDSSSVPGLDAALAAWAEYQTKTEAESEASSGEEDAVDDTIQKLTDSTSESNVIHWEEYQLPKEPDTDIIYSLEAVLPQFLRKALHGALRESRIWLLEHGLMKDPLANRDEGESTLVRNAREAVDENQRSLEEVEKKMRKDQEDLDSDRYGPNGIFRALKDRCLTGLSGEYVYELCWLGQTYQKSRKGDGKTTLGTFDRFERRVADDMDRGDGKSIGRGERLVLFYENGQRCWNGPRRRTEVWLRCAEKEELWRVSETQKCEYKMDVGSPAVCEDPSTKPPREKDEL